jgi:hypothetical protein
MTVEFGLHRNVHPTFVEKNSGRVGSEAFSPKHEEDYKLSVDCKKIWLARQSFEFRTGVLQRVSFGVWTIPRSEVSRIGLPVLVDVVENNNAHSLIDMSQVDKSARRDAARRLAAYANDGALSFIFEIPTS